MPDTKIAIPSPAQEKFHLRKEREFEEQVEDARLLLDYMLAERPMGGKDEVEVSVPPDIIASIDRAEEALAKGLAAGMWTQDRGGLSQGAHPSQSPTIPAGSDSSGEAEEPSVSTMSAMRQEFQMAYQRLVRLAKPVTADSLKATDKKYGRLWGFWFWKAQLSDAARWSRTLWMGTILLVLIALVGEMLPEHFRQFIDTEDSESRYGWVLYLVADLLNRLTPFLYGAVGACAYLLRSAHYYIRNRSFDRRCVPEYFNRILLGAVSGGAIILFISQVNTEDGETIKLGASALGFLAGYNTEFLFNTIERIIAAILPKVDVSAMKRATPPNVEVLTTELLRAMENAKDEPTRASLRDFLKKVQERM